MVTEQLGFQEFPEVIEIKRISCFFPFFMGSTVPCQSQDGPHVGRALRILELLRWVALMISYGYSKLNDRRGWLRTFWYPCFHLPIGFHFGIPFFEQPHKNRGKTGSEEHLVNPGVWKPGTDHPNQELFTLHLQILQVWRYGGS